MIRWPVRVLAVLAACVLVAFAGGSASAAPVQPEPTSTPVEPEPTSTPVEPEPTSTPVEPEPTATPAEPAPSAPVTAAPYPESGGEAVEWECRDAVAGDPPVPVGSRCTVTAWAADPVPVQPEPTSPAEPAPAGPAVVELVPAQWDGVVAGFGLLVLCGSALVLGRFS